jgi:HNH endonuclease
MPDEKAKQGQPVLVFNLLSADFPGVRGGYPDDWHQRRTDCLRRDGYCCRLCGSRDRLHVHHVKPISFGGIHDLQNLVTLCNACHMKQEYYMHRELVRQNIRANKKFIVSSYTRSDGVVVNSHRRKVGRRNRFWRSIRSGNRKDLS